MSAFIAFIQQYTGGSSHCTKSRKWSRRLKDQKEKGKTAPICRWYNCLCRNPKGIYKTTTRGISPDSSCLVRSLGQRLEADSCLVLISPQNMNFIFISFPICSHNRLLMSTYLVLGPEDTVVGRGAATFCQISPEVLDPWLATEHSVNCHSGQSRCQCLDCVLYRPTLRI